MSPAVDLRPVLSFLGALRRHNNRVWFEAHRDAYEIAKGQFEAFVARVVADVGTVADLSGVVPKDCIMRIYRDTRFSPDKSPYRTHLAAHIAPGGRKASKLGYYLPIAPRGGSVVAAGLYMPSPAQITTVRLALAADATRLRAILADREFIRYFRALEGDKVKTAPKGFARDHPAIDLLRFKQLLAVHHVSDATVLSRSFPAHVARACRAVTPFVDYLNEVLES
jgi:uncharacterized protein (TIGR02453 family)